MKNLFATKNDAIECLKNIDGICESVNVKGQYYNREHLLAHGEYSSPNYTVRRYTSGWAIHAERFFLSTTYNARRSGRVDDEFFDRITA